VSSGWATDSANFIVISVGKRVRPAATARRTSSICLGSRRVLGLGSLDSTPQADDERNPSGRDSAGLLSATLVLAARKRPALFADDRVHLITSHFFRTFRFWMRLANRLTQCNDSIPNCLDLKRERCFGAGSGALCHICNPASKITIYPSPKHALQMRPLEISTKRTPLGGRAAWGRAFRGVHPGQSIRTSRCRGQMGLARRSRSISPKLRAVP
jgi:hypothetical protein